MSRKVAPKVLYTNFINLSGLYSAEPVACHRRKKAYAEGYEYWDRKGDVDCTADGLKNGLKTNKNGVITGIVSIRREDVRLWTEGVLSMAVAMERFCQA